MFTKVLRIGTKRMLVATIRDQSHWLELEKQKNISKMKTQTFASAAHEFKNPLQGIVSSLEILNDKILQSGRKYYSIAKNCSQLMLFLTNDILDFAQFESKSLLLNRDSFNVREVFE